MRLTLADALSRGHYDLPCSSRRGRLAGYRCLAIGRRVVTWFQWHTASGAVVEHESEERSATTRKEP
jgi:hypothetical protein